MSGILQSLLFGSVNVPQEAVYLTPGTYTWTVPAGVTSICVVCVGGGASTATNINGLGSAFCGGSSGGLTYKNNISVTPGANYTVVVGAGGFPGSGSASSFSGTGVSMTAGGGTINGRSATVSGGDVNNLGRVSTYNNSPSAGIAYIGAGGWASYTYNETNTAPTAANGGILRGTVTIAGSNYTGYTTNANSNAVSLRGIGQNDYYAGTGASIDVSGGVLIAQASSNGGVRIIWGAGKSYPSNAV